MTRYDRFGNDQLYRNKKKKKLSETHKNIIIWASCLLELIFFAFIFATPLFNDTSTSIDFSIEEEGQNKFRVGYPIPFGWYLTSSPSQAFIIWGDGSSEDITKNISGSVEHCYTLQGRYSPTLLIWNSYGHLRSKSIEIVIENDLLEFYIDVKDKIVEGEEVTISVDSIFRLNRELSKTEENLTFIFDISETQILSNKSSITYRWKNAGTFPIKVTVMDTQGVLSRESRSITVQNRSPEAHFMISSNDILQAWSQIEFSAEESIDTINDKDSLQYLWNWGDNSVSWGKFVSHTYYDPGVYRISLCVIDDDAVSDTISQLVTIEDPFSSVLPLYNSTSNEPFITIGPFLEEAFEDEEVQFTAEINRNITDFSVHWSFGDGIHSYDRAPKHAWSHAGIYSIVMEVIDSDGEIHTRSKSIMIKEKAPEIKGPFNFQGVEGQALVLDVEVYDSIIDMPYLTFNWYDENNQLISNEKKPTLLLREGRYTYRLNVTDPSGMISSQEITVDILPRSHEVYVPCYMYHGAPGFPIQLRVCVYDTTIEPSEYTYYWKITNGNSRIGATQLTLDFHQISFSCSKTAIYQGEVKVVDANGLVKVATFEIYSFIDSTLNGIVDEYERMVYGTQLHTSTADDSQDSDKDNLPDTYEDTVSYTDKFDPDTDDDGLYDGYDSSGVGELTLGTNAHKDDSDGDGLKDSREYYGWELSIEYFENRSTFHVNSDPLVSDTDEDGLSDYEEFMAGTNPRLCDSDCDRLMDAEDPFPTTWDQDHDFLSDYMELRLGTEVNISDTDLDGINDGEEVLGWGVLNYRTNPVYADSDNDFLNDFAEVLDYNYDIEDEYGNDIRLDLNEPVALHFPEFFRKATLAQISFALTFGEYGEDNTQAYGVQESYVQDLLVTITKSDDNIVLYNSTTNSTRYFSNVVEITKIMNNKSLNYYGDYEIAVMDLNNESAIPKCVLEQFELYISRYLDPHDEDTDDDGIWDGVEAELLVKGTDRIDIHDIYNTTVASEENENDIYGLYDFSLEVPQTGRIFDGNLTIELTSDNTLLGSGNVSLQIIKQNVNKSIEDVILLDHFEFLFKNEQFWYYHSLELSDYIETGIMSEYCGTYFLVISIHDTNPNDTFCISEFYIETDTYVQAGVHDKHAYKTDPALKDSDEDGWSDYYEIFTSGTNPLNKDMDGDSAWDPNDRDPFRNVMIEIRPTRATYLHSLINSPTLEIILKFHVNDITDPDFSDISSVIGFCTTAQQASSFPNEWGGYQISWWTDGEGHAYYFDISDDITLQSDTISFYFQLWQMNSIGDVDIFGGEWLEAIYSLNAFGGFETLVVEKNGNRVACRVETMWIERTNTIAIYDPNATDFTGHYNEEERMNIIQLHVAPDGHYDATYSFLNEEEGSTIVEWNENEGWIDNSNSGCNPTIVNNIDGHHKVLQFYDSSATKAGCIINDWVHSCITGTVELWARTSSATDITDIVIGDGSITNSLYFRFDDDGNMKYYDGGAYYTLGTYQADRWYHIRFDWTLTDVPWMPDEKYWNVRVDGQYIGMGLPFYGAPVAMNCLVLQTDVGSAGYSFYVDAIGYSFDPEYKIGDNLIRSDCSGTPFTPGPNIIVIPTSLFTKTLLNSYFEKEQLGMTPLYTTKKGLFELYSIDRNGNIVDRQCGDSDFVFIRYGISAHDAMEVLESLLICATNQTTDENEQTITELSKVFDFVSMVLNGTRAVTLNLPQGILAFIPLNTNFECSEFGRAPRPFNFFSLLAIIVLTLVFPLALLTIVIVDFFIKLFTNIAEDIGMKLLTFLANLLWIVLRTALLILFYILLAIELLTNSIMFLGIGLLFGAFSLFGGMSCRWSINWCVPYGLDTQVGYLELEVSENSFTIEANVLWTYWEFFDLYIPLLTMNSDIDSLLNTTTNLRPEEPLPPELACGWDHIKDLKYDFHVLYRHPDGFAPEYVKLVLVSPYSNDEFEYLMEPFPGQQIDNYYYYVRFNYTIDFEQEFSLEERQGQWLYYFISEASEVYTTQRWPYEGLAIGPLIDEVRSYLISSYQYPYSGNSHQEFYFEVMGADYLENQKPINVLLNILWPNESIQTFSMTEESVFTYNGTDFTTYEKVLNFSKFLVIDESITPKYYFEASFSDGKISQLWDYEDLSEDDLVDDDLTNYTYVQCWFEGPTIYPYCTGVNKPPIIREWYVQDLTWNRLVDNKSRDRVLYPVSDEFILRFYIYVEDPDGDHIQHYRNGFEFTPKLILTNLDTPNSFLEPIPMKWTGGNYGPGPEQYDEYFVDLIGSGAYAYKYNNKSDLIKCGFGPGAWKYSFQVSDNQSHTTIENPDKKIWHIGSIDHMVNTLFYGSPVGYGAGGLVGSIIISVAYTAMALLASSKNHYLQMAAQIVSVGLLIVDFAINIWGFITYVFETMDTGALFGLFLNFLFKSCGFLISLLLSKDETGRFNFNFLSKISGVTMAISMFLLLYDELWPNFSTDEDGNFNITLGNDSTVNDLLGGLPLYITSFLASIIGLTSSLFIASGFAKFGGGSDGVSKIIIFHTVLSFAMSALCLVVFLQKTGFFHVAGDMLYMSAYSWGMA
ncbi:MAG: PKD domain-containing protein [Candidatus Odinarchaeota archaeon]